MAAPVFVSTAVVAVGTTLTSSGSSQQGTVPTTADGRAARFVRVTASTLAYIKFGADAPVTCTINDILITSTPSVFPTNGCGFFAVLQETAASKVNVVPVEF